MTIFIPRQCSEQEPDGVWEDCSFATGIMLNNAAHGANKAPSTPAEFEALRAQGYPGQAPPPEGHGSNYGAVQTAIKARYGWTPKVIGPPAQTHPSWAAIQPYLQPGWAMGVQGSMGAWPSTHHWNRWDPGFSGTHSTFVERLSPLSRVWWMNPLAPNSYPGEWMWLADLQRYYEAFQGAIIVARVGQLVPVPPKPPAPKPTPAPAPADTYTMHIAHGAKITAYKVTGRGPTTPGCLVMPPVIATSWNGAASSAPCGPKVYRKTCDGSSQATTALVTGGAFKGQYVLVGPGVTVTSP